MHNQLKKKQLKTFDRAPAFASLKSLPPKKISSIGKYENNQVGLRRPLYIQIHPTCASLNTDYTLMYFTTHAISIDTVIQWHPAPPPMYIIWSLVYTLWLIAVNHNTVHLTLRANTRAPHVLPNRASSSQASAGPQPPDVLRVKSNSIVTRVAVLCASRKVGVERRHKSAAAVVCVA